MLLTIKQFNVELYESYLARINEYEAKGNPSETALEYLINFNKASSSLLPFFSNKTIPSEYIGRLKHRMPDTEMLEVIENLLEKLTEKDELFHLLMAYVYYYEKKFFDHLHEKPLVNQVINFAYNYSLEKASYQINNLLSNIEKDHNLLTPTSYPHTIEDKIAILKPYTNLIALKLNETKRLEVEASLLEELQKTAFRECASVCARLICIQIANSQTEAFKTMLQRLFDEAKIANEEGRQAYSKLMIFKQTLSSEQLAHLISIGAEYGYDMFAIYLHLKDSRAKDFSIKQHFSEAQAETTISWMLKCLKENFIYQYPQQISFFVKKLNFSEDGLKRLLSEVFSQILPLLESKGSSSYSVNDYFKILHGFPFTDYPNLFTAKELNAQREKFLEFLYKSITSNNLEDDIGLLFIKLNATNNKLMDNLLLAFPSVSESREKPRFQELISICYVLKQISIPQEYVVRLLTQLKTWLKYLIEQINLNIFNFLTAPALTNTFEVLEKLSIPENEKDNLKQIILNGIEKIQKASEKCSMYANLIKLSLCNQLDKEEYTATMISLAYYSSANNFELSAIIRCFKDLSIPINQQNELIKLFIFCINRNLATFEIQWILEDGHTIYSDKIDELIDAMLSYSKSKTEFLFEKTFTQLSISPERMPDIINMLLEKLSKKSNYFDKDIAEVLLNLKGQMSFSDRLNVYSRLSTFLNASPDNLPLMELTYHWLQDNLTFRNSHSGSKFTPEHMSLRSY